MDLALGTPFTLDLGRLFSRLGAFVAGGWRHQLQLVVADDFDRADELRVGEWRCAPDHELAEFVGVAQPDEPDEPDDRSVDRLR